MDKDGFISNTVRRFVENWMPKVAEKDTAGNWWYWVWLNGVCSKAFGENPLQKFEDQNAFFLASHLSELFFPIDALADRVASLPFEVVNENGEIVEPSENIKRLIEGPNVFATFSENMYNAVFNELSDGNNYIYTKTPRSIKGVSPDTVSSVWVLQPDKVDIKIKNTRPSYFDITDKSDVIDKYVYTKFGSDELDPRYVIHERSLSTGDYSTGLKSPSPLIAAEKNINNLLAVYSARYKVYVNNGNAGILTKDNGSANNSLEQAVDPTKREDIINDILDRNGLTGDKKLWTVSAIPLKFINTLATIKDLQPFDETYADALQIAGIFGVDKDLIPMKEGTTFTNKEQAEKSLYQNVITGIANDKAKSFTKAYALDRIGLRFQPNFKNIAVLQPDRERSFTGDKLLIDNIIRMKETGLVQESDVSDIIGNLIDKYKDGQA
jgi:phage portal protein BeeE